MNPELARMVAKLKTLRADRVVAVNLRDQAMVFNVGFSPGRTLNSRQEDVDRICGDIMRLERKIIEALLEEMA